MLVLLVPMTLHDFSSVRLVLFNRGVSYCPNILMHIEVEQRPTFAPRLVDNKFIKAMLMGNNQILFHVEEILNRGRAYLSKFRSQLLLNCSQEFSYCVTFPNLYDSTMTSSIPVTVCNLQRLIFDARLLLKPFTPQTLSLGLFLSLTLSAVPPSTLCQVRSWSQRLDFYQICQAFAASWTPLFVSQLIRSLHLCLHQCHRQKKDVKVL